MKVIVCGGRDYDDKDYLFACLEEFHQSTPITTLVHGAAKGADTLAGDWAATHPEIEIKAYPANWQLYGKAAGRVRNLTMLIEEKPDCVIAFPGGFGTKHMVSIAKYAEITVKSL